jgi:hypothetical protein
MAAMAATHTTRAVNRSSAGVWARSTTDTFHRARVAVAKTTGALAMDAAFTMSVLSMQGCLVRPVRVAHDLAEVEPVVVRNFTPSLPRLYALLRCR